MVTVTSQVAVNPPSSVFTLIVVEPSEIAVTIPFSIVAIFVSELLQATVVTAAFSGTTVAVSVPVVPVFSVNVVGVIVTPVTDTFFKSSSSEQAVKLSEIRAVMKVSNANLNFFIFFLFLNMNVN